MTTFAQEQGRKAPSGADYGTRWDVTLAWCTALGWAAVLGVLSGTACVGVRLAFRLLQWAVIRHTGLLPDVAAGLSPAHRLLIPVLGGAGASGVLWAAKRWSRAAPFEEYVEAVRFQDGRIPFASTLWRTLSSAFSVATGATVGREGSMIQFAAAVTSWTAARVRIKALPVGTQVACGAAAAVAAAYQAPVAGVFFATEIVLGDWTWSELPGLAVASTSGWLVSRLLLGGESLFAVHGVLSLRGFLWTLPLALLLGALGPWYQKLLRSLSFARRLPVPLVWGGFVVGLLSLLHPAVWGNGDVALVRTLSGTPALLSVFTLLAFRLLASTACVGTGTIGGVFTPTLFAGAALGLIGGHLAHAPQPVLLAVTGLSAFLASVTHAPIMAGVMAVELTGQWHLLPLFLVLNFAAYHVAKRISPQSLYAIATPTPAQTFVDS